MKKFAVIVAGGNGARMGAGIPKQFLPLHGIPVLFHTILKFEGLVDEIILVLPGSHITYWNQLCESHNFNLKIQLVEGGLTRTQSVNNGLKSISEPGIVAIHDAVRPLVSKKLITKLFNEAASKGNAIPAIAVKDSLRQRIGEGSISVNREDFVSVQTPQCFDLQIIKTAYEHTDGQEFTDDAGVIDFEGGQINLVEGEISNIKITFKEDISLAEILMGAGEM